MLPAELLLDPLLGYEVLLVCVLLPFSILWLCIKHKSKQTRRKKKSSQNDNARAEPEGKKVENTERLSVHGEVDEADDPIRSHTELPTAPDKNNPADAAQNLPTLQDAKEPTIVTPPDAKTPRPGSVDQPMPKIPIKQKKSKAKKKRRNDTAEVPGPPTDEGPTKKTQQEPLSRDEKVATMDTQDVDDQKLKPRKDKTRPAKTCLTQQTEDQT